MRKIKEKYGLLILGVLIGIVYGIVTRVVFGERATLASITYLFLIPMILGIVPLVFANEIQIRSYRNIIFIPWITTATFFLTTVLVGMEEFICLLVLAGPFFILGTIGALIIRLIILHRRSNNKILAVMVLPFLLSPLEEAIKSPSEIYKVESEVIIAASPETVWNNIVEVPAIREDEYTPGIFNRLGIPRPLSADVTAKEKGATRIGNFEGGLRFVETLNDFQPHERVSFSIVVEPASVSSRVFDQHVLNGNYFTFVEAAYELSAASPTEVRLKLSSSYRLTSKVNFYGKFWGDMILKDFQDRLLNVIENRSETKPENDPNN